MSKTVSIGFSRPKKFKLFAWLIMKVEGTDFSHTFVTWKDDKIERRKVFEAVGGGIRILGNVEFKTHAYVTQIYRYKTDELGLKSLEQYSIDNSGKPYGFKHILGLLMVRVARLFGKRISNPFKDGDYSMICLEAGGQVLVNCLGLDIQKDLEDCGLLEYNRIIRDTGERISQETIDRING